MSYEVTVNNDNSVNIALTSQAFEVTVTQLGDLPGGDMVAATYDPQDISADAFARANHTGTQTLSTISDAGTAAAADTGDFVSPSALGVTVAELVSGKVPAGQLPSFVDDVVEYADFASFPATGEAGKLYIDFAQEDVYRWSGSAYVQVNDAVSSADQATKLATTRTIALGGDASGSASFDGSADATISVTVADDSHNHVIGNVDGLQGALEGKVDDAQVLTDVPLGAVFTDTTYTVGDGGLTEINFTTARSNKLATATQPGDLGLVATSNDYDDLDNKPSLSAGNMQAATYDPQSIEADVFARANHTGTQPLSTVSGTGTAAPLDVPATGDAAVGEVVKGDDTRLSDARAPTAHNHTLADITDSGTAAASDASDFATSAQGGLADTAQQPPTEGAFVDGDKTKLDGSATLTGTETLTNKTLTDPKINVGSDATGDLYYRALYGSLERLPVGADDEVLTVANGLPSWAEGGGGVESYYQEFTASGTWTKPDGASFVYVEAVGGGGSGGGGGGGGGGAGIPKLFRASDLGGTETVTIGSGGAAVVSGPNAGNDGGNSGFSSVTANGGKGGHENNSAVNALLTQSGRGGSGKMPVYVQSNVLVGDGDFSSGSGGLGNAEGGSCVLGGAGGSGTSTEPGGVSALGGDGGSTATAGQSPGGGGGGTDAFSSGAGADGRVRVWSW